MNYINKVKELLDNELTIGEVYKDLLNVYALLVLTVGEDCTNENVHDAWSVWQNQYDDGHPSLIPFKELTKRVQDFGIEYRDAIIKVAKTLKTQCPHR